MTIIGADLSHWQGQLTPAQAALMALAGVKFAYVKASQGAAYADDCFENNVRYLRAAGILIGAYHFVTTDNAAKQYANFIACMGDWEYDLPPALDCEAYTQTSRYAPGEVVSRDTVFGLTYPTEAVIDSMGRQLTAWMQARPKMAVWRYPAIYTNKASGDRIFKTASMSRYLLWVANWGVTAPNKPKVWANTPHFIWQDYVIQNAVDYGLPNTALDHDVWGPLLPFPTDAPTPPPTDSLAVTIVRDGKTYKGELKA